jgi:hypothetical protein
VPYSRFSAWICTADDAFITVAAWPNASDAPKPVMVWNVVPPLTVAVEAANAGTAGPATAIVPAVRAVPAATAVTWMSRILPGITRSLLSAEVFVRKRLSRMQRNAKPAS